MAQESCNLDKEEAEVLKPSSPRPHPPPSASSSSSSSSPSPHSPSTSPSAPLFLNTTKEISSESMARTGVPSAAAASGGTEHVEESQPLVLLSNRCSNCRKRVGLTGFRCRCGDLFCARHRHSGTHNCSFDYKAAGREEIFKANPLVRAAKIIKI